jgi:KRAB domain-containing zinc finger protein
LAVHKRTHIGDKPYECHDLLNKRFSDPSNFATHKRTHAGDKPYECHVCNEKFSSESHKLTQHKIKAPKRNQSFECDKYKKTFTLRKNLKRHWRVYLRDGLLFCNSCGREISQSQGQGHANDIMSDDHFVCDKCNKQFPDFQSLYQHKTKDHGTSYQCDVCKELEAREATGIGYICCVCDAEFEIATELEDHISMHDNVLPH